MNKAAKQFNEALEEFQQFGPRRRIRIEDRWLKILPDVNPAEFPNLKKQCHEIEEFALNLAEQVRDKKLSEEIARRQLIQKFPVLNQERLAHTWSQAIYFALK